MSAHASDFIDKAEGWISAQVRGNNHPMSDDRVLHLVVSLIEDHHGWPRSAGGLKVRLDGISERTSEMDARARRCLLAAWALRYLPDDTVVDVLSMGDG